MAADGSMAVWSEFRDGATDAVAEVHFNYWRIIGDASFFRRIRGSIKDFIEVGVLLENAPSVEKVVIFLPGLPGTWTVEDCGPRFASPDIAHGIFNAPLTSNYAAHPDRIDLLKPGQIPFCRVHIFPTENAVISAEHLHQTIMAGGTLLTITRHAINEVCEGLPDNMPAYFRLRAYLDAGQKSPFIKRIQPKDRFFTTGYSVVDYLDFRLNEARSLPASIEEMMRQAAPRVPHRLIAFLTAVPVQSDVTTISWEKAHKKRLLEDDLWSTYVPTEIPRGMTVYHWKEVATAEEKTVDDFSGFIKMQTRLVSWPVLVTSIAIAFCAGVAGNLFASWVWNRVYHTPAAFSSAPSAAQRTIPPKPGKSNVTEPEKGQK